MNAIITERLIIRRPKESDLKDFLVYRNDVMNLRFQPIKPINENCALTLLKKQMIINEDINTGLVMFAIELKSEKRMIGEVAIYISSDNKSNGDLGWSIHKDYQGNGYAIEAAKVLLDYAFKHRNLQRVTATCVSINKASFMLMKHLAMHREVNRTNSQFINGIRYDEHLYTISFEEWTISN